MKSLLWFLFFIAVIVLCYYFVDRQVVSALATMHSRQWRWLAIFANDIVAVLGALIILVYIYGMAGVFDDRQWVISTDLLLVCHSVVVSIFVKDGLKILFGRFWPATFVCHNPSFLSNHVYGFNWFHSGTAYQSFPSGHATFIMAFSAALWLLYPRLRWLAGLLTVLVIVGQIGMYYHFVSDVVAGIGLGLLSALFTVRTFKTRRIFHSC